MQQIKFADRVAGDVVETVKTLMIFNQIRKYTGKLDGRETRVNRLRKTFDFSASITQKPFDQTMR